MAFAIEAMDSKVLFLSMGSGELHPEGVLECEHHAHTGVRSHAQPEKVVHIAQVSNADCQPCMLTKYAPYLLGDRGPLSLG